MIKYMPTDYLMGNNYCDTIMQFLAFQLSVGLFKLFQLPTEKMLFPDENTECESGKFRVEVKYYFSDAIGVLGDKFI